MQYSKTMIDLIKEVRRRVPAEQKPAIKLANPEVMTEIKNIFHSSKDAVLRAIAKELFELAGPPWNTALKAPLIDEPAQPNEGYIVKSYRGVTQLLERAERSAQNSREHARKRVYRGQVIHT